MSEIRPMANFWRILVAPSLSLAKEAYVSGATHLSDTNPTPDGFVTTMTAWQMLMLAYAPDDGSTQTVPMINEPKWLSSSPSDWYVINARVSDADRDACAIKTSAMNCSILP